MAVYLSTRHIFYSIFSKKKKKKKISLYLVIPLQLIEVEGEFYRKNPIKSGADRIRE